MASKRSRSGDVATAAASNEADVRAPVAKKHQTSAPNKETAKSAAAPEEEVSSMETNESLGRNVGRLLTHVDAAVREQTVEKLIIWMSAREAQVGNLTELELAQLWKALHYCMWLTDKPLVQEEMSNNLAGLSRAFRRPANVHAYFQAFFACMRREWTTIDYLRLNKYLALVRRMMREWFTHLLTLGTEQFSREFAPRVMLPRQADGLRMHVASLYLTELHAVFGSSAETPLLKALVMDPFIKVALAPETSEVMFRSTADDVFGALAAKYAPLETASEDSLERFQAADFNALGDALFQAASALPDTELVVSRRKRLYALSAQLKKAGEATAAPRNAKPAAPAAESPRLPTPTMIPSSQAGSSQEASGRRPRRNSVSEPAVVPPAAKPVSPILSTKAAPHESIVVEKREHIVPVLSFPSTAAAENSLLDTSVVSTASRKSVRFSHSDSIGINKINMRMLSTPLKPASEFGEPAKRLLKKTAPVSSLKIKPEASMASMVARWKAKRLLEQERGTKTPPPSSGKKPRKTA